LSGAIDPHGTEVKYDFEYGATGEYGSRTAEVSAGAGAASLEENEQLTGLAPGTVYHYRLVAVAAFGEVDGQEETFTTAMNNAMVEGVTPIAIALPTVGTAVPTATTAVKAGPPAEVLAFGDLSLPAVQHGSSLSVGLSVDLAGARVEVEVTVSAAQLSGATRRDRQRPVELARLVRPHVGVGRLKLTVPLDAAGRHALRRHGHLALTVKIVVTPATGKPQTATGAVKLERD
jgi:hypothetical protein